MQSLQMQTAIPFAQSYKNYSETLSVWKRSRAPTFANQLVDLGFLYQEVQQLGGYCKVTSDLGWRSIAKRLDYNYENKRNTSGTARIKNFYKTWLLAYEESMNASSGRCAMAQNKALFIEGLGEDSDDEASEANDFHHGLGCECKKTVAPAFAYSSPESLKEWNSLFC
jgi:predicted secreted protein